MNKYVFNYDEWLSGHSSRKSMIEKLERSLVPFELFESVGLKNDKQARIGEVKVGANTYHYDIRYDYRCNSHDVYNADLKAVEIVDRWHNLLMGYNRFKVVMDHQSIKTIYSDHEDYFQQVINMFENDDYAGLYAHRSSYINNLLARYILLRLLEVHRQDLQLLTAIDTPDDGLVSVLAANANRTEWIMYAFSKREAREKALRYDGDCKKLTVIYFFNQDFEKDGNTVGYNSGSAKIVSARSFMQSLPLETKEKLLIEKRMLMLISLLYNEHLDWHFDRIERVAIKPPYYGEHMKEQKKVIKQQKEKAKKGKSTDGMPWYQRIHRTLLEDALNVLGDKPTKHSDIFHFLCAANLVNAYVNQCNRRGSFTTKQVNRMYQAKQQIFRCLLQLAKERNPHIRISVSTLPAILTNIKVENHDYQISFRGMTDEVLEKISNTEGVGKGHFEGYYLQPIASALYMYSYMLRWKGLDTAQTDTEIL